MYFCYFRIIAPWKRAMRFIWKKTLNPHHPRMHFAKFGRNWHSGSGEEDFKIFSMYFRYFSIISTWRKAGPFTQLQRRRRTTDKFWSEKLTWAFALGELKGGAQNGDSARYGYTRILKIWLIIYTILKAICLISLLINRK